MKTSPGGHRRSALAMDSLIQCGTVFLLCITMHSLAAPCLQAQDRSAATSGLAWQVKGNWQEDGKGAFLQNGDAIHPRSLLQPVDLSTIHSITALMPDGQRLFYECFTAEDCARGFRVPQLYRRPLALGVDLIAKIRAGLADQSRVGQAAAVAQRAVALPRDESVVSFGADHRVKIAGLATRLENGHYTYDLHPLDRTIPSRNQVPLQKTGPSIEIELPAPGLYSIKIRDDLNADRIDLLIAAVRPDKAAALKKSFADVKALLDDWNAYYQGWPIHEFQRAYLDGMVGNLRASAHLSRSSAQQDIAAGQPTAAEAAQRGKAAGDPSAVTAEPVFMPAPGLMKGDTAIKLRCDTKGAEMHFTVDGSQPNAASPVYGGAIMLKGTEITIKVFASSAGRRDSPVITGVFIIEGSDPT